MVAAQLELALAKISIETIISRLEALEANADRIAQLTEKRGEVFLCVRQIPSMVKNLAAVSAAIEEAIDQLRDA